MYQSGSDAVSVAVDLDPLLNTHEMILQPSPLDEFLSRAVKFTGSLTMFWSMWLGLLAWFVWGSWSDFPNHWQIFMQDGQSIQTYVWDTLLMRQQLDDTDGFLKTYGKLKSRGLTIKRLLQDIPKEHEGEIHMDIISKLKYDLINDDHHFTLEELSWFDKLSNLMSEMMGSLPSIVIFWIGIFVWLWCGTIPLDDGDGIPRRWSDRWQMYINTIVAVELLITSVFLENIRSRNNDYMRYQLDKFGEFDAKLERILRVKMNNDLVDNPLVKVNPYPKPGLKRVISKYSDIIGTGIGLVISSLVFVSWLLAGPWMSWDDDWWLIIGTYTGLVSFIDSFALRCVYFDITNYEEERFLELLHDSQEMIELLGLEDEVQLELPRRDNRLIDKISIFINDVCSSQWSVLVSVAIVMALLTVATSLHWSTTGQLLANTPTMIIEGFFHLILIQAHNWADRSRTDTLKELVKSRKALYCVLNN